MNVKLIRYDEDQDGTFGFLLMQGKPFKCFTLEPQDKGNAANISCIPPGEYTCGITDSPKYGLTFEVQDVPGRSHILFHAGNVLEHTKGCILLGAYEGKLKGDRAVLNSGLTFKQFLQALSGMTSFNLEIAEVRAREPKRMDWCRLMLSPENQPPQWSIEEAWPHCLAEIAAAEAG